MLIHTSVPALAAAELQGQPYSPWVKSKRMNKLLKVWLEERGYTAIDTAARKCVCECVVRG